MLHGSYANKMYAGRETEKPYVGMGATRMMYSDRQAYTVQKIISDKRVIVTRDTTKLVEGSHAQVHQEYEYIPTPLVEGERAMMCRHPYKYLFEQGCTCKRMDAGLGCEGCEHFKMHKPMNGIILQKCKKGWKELGGNDYFTLGVKEEWFDPYF